MAIAHEHEKLRCIGCKWKPCVEQSPKSGTEYALSYIWLAGHDQKRAFSLCFTTLVRLRCEFPTYFTFNPQQGGYSGIEKEGGCPTLGGTSHLSQPSQRLVLL